MTTKQFFLEFKRLTNLFPKPPLYAESIENCMYINKVYNSKNVNHSFDCASCTDSLYIYDSYLCDGSIDCDYAIESQLCYESVDPIDSFNGIFLEYCRNVRDASYAYNCINCHDIFGCANLKNKSFCILNRQLTEDDYRKTIGQYKSLPPEKVLILLEELKSYYPLTQTHQVNDENTFFSNYSFYNKNSYLCFDAAYNKESAYLYDSAYDEFCYDMIYSYHSEHCYQLVDCDKMFNCNFCVFTNYATDSMYLFNCYNVKDCFGCVGIQNKQYCLLNRQLTKQVYTNIQDHLLKQMKREKPDWGEILGQLA